MGQHRCQGCDIISRLRGGERGFGPRGRICSDFQGHGRLQCLCRAGEASGSEPAVFDCERTGRKCGGQGVLRIQGCGEGCAAVRRARSSGVLLMLALGRTVHTYPTISSWIHCAVEGASRMRMCVPYLIKVKSWTCCPVEGALRLKK